MDSLICPTLTHLPSNSCGPNLKEAATTGLVPQETLDDEKAALDTGRNFECDSGPEEDA